MLEKQLQRLVVLVAFLGLAFASTASAQSSSTGAITGAVKDPSGAVIPNVTVTATSAATGTTRIVMTGADGTYTLGLLPPGGYSVEFEANGFQKTTAPSVTVTVTETGILDQMLQVGAQTQEVTVQANVETVETTNATVGATIAGRTVTDLPLATRNYTNLLSQSAGSNASVANAASLGKDTQPTSVGGANQQQNNYQMDGASIVSYTGVGGVTEGGSRGAFGIPNPDTIQEFKIQTSQYDAGYGRNPGANVNVVTKSGSNDFHGDAFEYFRNTVLNAADWFAKLNGITSNTNRLLDQNQYGGTLGGPVKKDKLFFFVSYQGTDQKNGEAGFGQIQTFLPALPSGSRGTCPAGAAAISQCDAAAQAFAQALGAQYAGKAGQIQQGVSIASNGSNINPTALQILQIKLSNGAYYIPTPLAGGGVASPGVTCGAVQGPSTTFPGTSWVGDASCTSVSPAIYHEYQGMGNWDYVINSKNTLSGREFYSADPSIQPFYQQGVNVPGTPENASFPNNEAVLKLTTVISSSLVNEARMSYQRNETNSSTLSPFLSSTAVGMTALNAGIGYNVLPRISIGTLTFGTSIFATTTNRADQFQWADQLSWTKGKHTIRTGFEVGHNNWNWNFIDGLGAGATILESPADFLLGLPGCTPGTFPATCNPGNPGKTNGTLFSDIFVEPNFATRFAPNGGDYHFWNWSYDAFFQDDFKITNRLTVNLGVRWEYDGYPSERNGLGTNVNTNFAALAPVPQVATPCQTLTTSPAPPTPCPGGTLIGFTVPSNSKSSIIGPLPAGVFVRSSTVAGEQKAPWNDFAPRFGFAWQPLNTNKWVIRGGVGFFYDYIGGENYVHGVLQSAPYAETIGGAATSIYFASLQQPFGTKPPNWIYRWVTASGQSSGITGATLAPSMPVPLTYGWNLNMQYELWPSWVVEVGYVGSRGIHQTTGAYPNNPALLQNAAITGATPTVADVNLRSPLLGFSPQLWAFANNTDYKYNGLQVTLRKQFSRGLLLQAAYSYNRAFDSVWNGNGAITGTTPNPTWALSPVISQYGSNPLYHPNRFTTNYNYELPLGKHEGALGVLASGWRVSGETTIQDGTPISIIDSGLGTIFGSPTAGNSPATSPAEYAAGQTSANVATAGSTTARVLNGAWINTNAFCASNSKTCSAGALVGVANGLGYGNAGLGTLLGPGQNNWNIALIKSTKVGGLREDANLEFQTQFFNAFNHPQFTGPGTIDVSSPSANKITSLSVNPRLIQFALKYVF